MKSFKNGFVVGALVGFTMIMMTDPKNKASKKIIKTGRKFLNSPSNAISDLVGMIR
jgi:hypothetical protein